MWSPGNCLRCTKPSERPTCVDCAMLIILEADQGFIISAKRARDYRLPAFYAECGIHGLTFHGPRKLDCLLCRDLKPVAHGNSVRATARKNGQNNYPGICSRHGETAFGTNSGKCLACFNSVGAPRAPDPVIRGNPTRAAARRARASSYLAICDRHGETPFGTNSGKCLMCFTANGYPRSCSA